MAHGLSCSVACGIFLDQGSNPCPLHWQADSYPLHHQGSPVDPFLSRRTTSPSLHHICNHSHTPCPPPSLLSPRMDSRAPLPSTRSGMFPGNCPHPFRHHHGSLSWTSPISTEAFCAISHLQNLKPSLDLSLLQPPPLFVSFPLEQNISKKPSILTASTCHSLRSSFCPRLPPKPFLSKLSTDLSLPKSNDQLSVPILLGLATITSGPLSVESLSSLGPQTAF